jgi:peptide chain release factor 2
LQQNLAIINQEIENPNIWENQPKAQKILQEKSIIEQKLQKFTEITKNLDNQKQYLELAIQENEQTLILDIERELKKILINANNFEIECLFNQENDNNNCFLDINAGAGGTDSCDFALMLLRMYERFSNLKGFKVEIVSMIDGEEAGIKSATLKISGNFAFGWLRTESGVHRLVRISPFNANDKRQTSFASIWVYPEADETINIEINEKDLRIDTFRASGAGGQHVNKTDSAVRITHLPTNIVVQCQSDRSQIKNRAEAMKMLKSRLLDLEIKKRKAVQEESEASKTDNSWGHQIRSYVLHPYQMVKDLRTNFETSDSQGVLNGEIDGFIKVALSYNNQDF